MSLGGAAAVALGYNTCCTDHRVDAIVAVSGAETVPGLPAFPGTYTYPRTPLLLIRGTLPFDFVAPYSEPIFAAAQAPKFLLTVTNGQHVPIVVDNAGGQTSWRAVIAFLGRYVKSRRHAAPRALGARSGSCDRDPSGRHPLAPVSLGTKVRHFGAAIVNVYTR